MIGEKQLQSLQAIYRELRNVANVNENVLSTYIAWRNAKQHYQRRLNRSLENWRYYLALDNDIGLGQWPEKAVAYMLAQNRQLLTYNFAKVVVDTISGGIMQVPYIPEFYPVNEEVTTLTAAIKKASFSDKEIMDWNTSYKDLVDAGLVFEGVIKGVVSNEFSDLGNIGFEMTLPGSVIPDPMWKTSRSRDCEECFHEQWFQPRKIFEMWGDVFPGLESLVRNQFYQGAQYGENTGVTPFSTDADTWGTALRVVSHYRLKKTPYTQPFLITPNGNINIPKELPDPASIIEWLNMTIGQDNWEPDRIFERKDWEKQCVVRRICPALSWQDVIEENKTEWQTGRLPFFWWSASRHNGEPHSIIDSIKDVQTNINYYESLITYKIQVEGGGGSQFVDRQGFANDEEFERYRRYRNNPLESFEVLPGYLMSGATPAKPTFTSQFPREVYEHLTHIIGTVLPYISKVPPAQRGTSEQSNQSGYLYKLMKMQSDQQLYTIYYGLRQFWNEVYESYLLQSPNTYSNELLPRKFTFNKGKESMVLNEPVTLPDGSQGIRNDVRELKRIRHKVIIAEVQDSPTKNLEDLQVLGEYMSKIPPDKPGTIQYLLNKSAEKIDQFDVEDREALKAIGEKELALAMETIDAKTEQAKLLKLQAAQQIQAILNPPQPPQIPGGMQAGTGAPAPQLPSATNGAMTPRPQAAGQGPTFIPFGPQAQIGA